LAIELHYEKKGAPADNMPEENPYRSPTPTAPVIDSGFATAVSQGVWRDGKLLMMTKTATLPPRCTRCNAPTEDRLKRKLSWHAPGWYLLLPASVLIYVIVALIIRETATIEVGYCAVHRRKRRRAIAIGWLVALAGLVLALVATNFPRSEPLLVVIGILMMLVGLIYGVVGSQVVSPKRIDKRFVWLKQVSPDYLAELPVREWG
jgi:hypothetical protein